MDSEDVIEDSYGRSIQPPCDGAFNGKEQALHWQQGHYMGSGHPAGQESGFHSGPGTESASVTGESDLLDPSAISDVVSTQGSLYSDVEGGSLHGFRQMFGSIAPLQPIPSSLGSGSERMEEFIPQLIKILRDEDQFVVTEALSNIDKCCRKEYFLKAVMSTQEIVNGIMNAIKTTELGFEAIKSASNIVRNMSLHQRGRHSILSSGGLPALVALLDSSVDRILFCAITILHNLLIHQEDGSKNAIKDSGGLTKMVSLLKKDNVKLLTIVTDCLRILAYGNQHSKILILEANGPFLLVQIMNTREYEKLLMMTSRLLKVLSVCSKNKLAIIQAGGMEALAKQVGHPNSRLMHNCIWTLRNLSDAGTMIDNIERFIAMTVHLLSHSDTNIVICAAGIMSNLTCNNQRNKIAVCHAGGLSALVDIIKRMGNNKDSVEPAMCALRHLTNNHAEFETAQNVLCYQLEALPFIYNVLHTSTYKPLLKAVLGVIRNLAQRESNHHILRENGFIPELVELLQICVEDRSGPTDGVGVQEIIEFTVGALLILAKDIQNRNIIRSLPQCLPTLISLIQNRLPENIIRVSVGVLCEISSDREGVFILQQLGATEPVKALLNSRNERIASYATAIMYSLSSIPKTMQSQDWSNQDLHHQGFNSVPQQRSGYANNGFDQSLPLDSMEGLGIGSHSGSTYGPLDDDCMDIGGNSVGAVHNDVSFDWTDL